MLKLTEKKYAMEILQEVEILNPKGWNGIQNVMVMKRLINM